ncbi:pentapeptide repeat-containing protein, partial [Aerosakkonemataceae cyanobacterium BLCC-F50]
MKLRIFTTVLILISTLGVDRTRAQTQQLNEEQLNQLCTQFPLNSQCRGFKAPVLPEEKTGYKAKCLFRFGDKKRKRECKVLVTEQGLTVSFEEEDPIDLVSGSSRDRQFQIPFNQIFALSYQQWSGIGKVWGIALPQEFLNVEVGFVGESTLPSGNRSNILTIFVDEKFKDTLNRLTSINTAPKLLLDNGVVAQLGTVEPPKDNSQQVKQLLETRQCIKCDLRGANLEKAKLEGANLEGANLAGANLEGANLKSAYLVGANFSKANLTKAQLEAAKLMVADLSEANLQNADLQGVNFQGANL